jgi:DNA repair protein RecO (recombination protein O)
MPTEKAEAIVLRTTDYSDTSRIVALFTDQFGRISALAKGGRRLKSSFENSLDLLADCQIVFISKSSGLDLLTSSQLIGRFRPQANDLNCLYAGYYVAELLLGLTEEYDPHPNLFQVTRETLSEFSQAGLVARAVLRFELAMLREIGQLPDFEVCMNCGSVLEGAKPSGFLLAESGLLCASCSGPDWRGPVMHGGTLRVLQMLSQEEGEVWRNLVLIPQQFREGRQLTTLSISYILGKQPKSLKLLRLSVG